MKTMGISETSTAPHSMRVRRRVPSTRLRWSAYSFSTFRTSSTSTTTNNRKATYSVNDDGRNRYPNDDIWLTDGYGDSVRNYLRAMASMPELAPDDQNHLLRTTSVVQEIKYAAD